MLCMLLIQPLPNNKNSDFFFEKSNFGQDFFAFLALCFAFDKKTQREKIFQNYNFAHFTPYLVTICK